MKVAVGSFFMGNEITMKCCSKIMYPWKTHKRASFHGFVHDEIVAMENLWKTHE